MTAKTTWLTEYLAVWATGAGTAVAALPAARAAKTFKALETAFGREDVLARWSAAWSATPEDQRKFLTPESFARRYGEFVPPSLDAFGFVVESAEQEDTASKVVAALSGDHLALARLSEQFGVPLSFPVGAILLRAYESLRGAHERSVRQHPATTNASQANPLHQKRMAHLIQALS